MNIQGGHRGQSLQLLMTALISFLVLLTALTLGFFYNNALQEQLLSAQANLFRATTAQVTGNINEYRSQAIATINMVAHSGVSQTYSTEERQRYVPQMVSALKANSSLQAIYLAYPNGDFFLVRQLDAAARRTFPDVTANARWMVQYATQRPNGTTEQQQSFIDEELIAIRPPEINHKHYDPRERPWYQQARHHLGPIGTHPYRFSTTGQTGITYAFESPDEAAITGVDIRLPTLGDVLKRNLPSPNAHMAIINQQHQILVTADDSEEHNSSPIPLDQSPSPHLSSLAKIWPRNQPTPRSFELDGQRWLVSLSPLNQKQADSPLLLMVMPENDLFADGQQITRQAIWIPVIILLIMLPISWLLSRIVSKPLHRLVKASERIQSMDFSDAPLSSTGVRELNELMAASESMKETIRDFIGLSRQIISESDLEPLLHKVVASAMRALPARRAALWLLTDNTLHPCHGLDEKGQPLTTGTLDISIPLLTGLLGSDQGYACIAPQDPALPAALQALASHETRQLILLPLRLESQEMLGLLVLGSHSSHAELEASHRINYLQALASFAAIAIDNRRLASALQQLMNALVELIAGAIDAKSPYTGGHCQRVPDLAMALAEAAHHTKQGPLAAFQLGSHDREALYIASWLHDCGKVTTPEHIVDKATKLETQYDRIHEIRMRFEVLKRDADITYWQGVAAGHDAWQLEQVCQQQKAELDEEFAFIAHCNLGGEFMRAEDLAKLRRIGQRRWLRTLDDRLGLGPMERKRLAPIPQAPLPVSETLLADKPEHRYPRSAADIMPPDNRWGFKVDMPELLYNKGELTNLGIRRGTLTEEERYKINAHMIETIKMLTALPFPGHLAQVPEIAGGHHERMDGKGYPLGLKGHEMSTMARIMAIADVFEALTAADRPYKPAKPMSEALHIMRKMSEEGHLDPQLFRLFLESGIWRSYTVRYLGPEQADVQDFHPYLPRPPRVAAL